MSNGNSSPGLSASDVRNIVRDETRSLAGEIQSLHNQINRLERHVDQEIRRLEQEMRDIAQLIVNALERQTQVVVEVIDRQTKTVVHGLERQTDTVVVGMDRQTVAVVGGVAATTIMLERTKSQIETDFQQTRHKLELQTESTLQIEVGKKISDVSSLRSKLAAFAQDIKGRYDKSLEGVAINRDLYDVNFNKIRDEYENKIRTIGDHIIRIREEDIAPAEAAARVPYEAAHSLPMELDLERLQLRSQSLDETLSLLKSNRLDEVLGSLDGVHQVLQAHDMGDQAPGKGVELRVEGLLVSSGIQTKLLVGCQAVADEASGHALLRLSDNSLSAYSSRAITEQFKSQLGQRKHRAASGQDLVGLSKAAQGLKQRGLMSDESLAMLEDFLGAGKLMVTEA